MAKKELSQVVHCGMIVTLKGGKGKCPKCDATIEAQIHTTKKPHSSRKVGSGGAGDSYTMRIGLGLFLLIAPPYIGISNLFKNGIGSFDNLAATLVVLSMIVGAALLGLFKNRKKA